MPHNFLKQINIKCVHFFIIFGNRFAILSSETNKLKAPCKEKKIVSSQINKIN